MEHNPHAIHVESNPYQIELAGTDHVDSNGHSDYRARLPTRASISRQGRALVKGVQDRGGCRLAICLVGVTLCWLSSLQVAAAFVEILFTPANGGPKVQQSWKQFGEQVNLERERNIECVNSSLGQCQDNLNTRFASMDFAVGVIYLQNDYLIKNATAYQARCSDAQNLKLKAIRKYKMALLNASLSIMFSSSCAMNVTTNLNRLYADPADTTNQATVATSQYGNSNEVTWQMAFDSMQARAAYDTAYWANKTQQMKDWYVAQGADINVPPLPTFDFGDFNTDLSDYYACVTVSNMTCPYPDGIRARADATVAQFKTNYLALSNSFYTSKNASQIYLDLAAAKFASFSSYATTANMDLKDINATLHQLASCGSQCSAQVAALTANFPTKPDIYLPIPDISIYSITNFTTPNWTDIMSGLDFGNATADVRAKLTRMTFESNVLSTQWAGAIDTSVLGQFNWSTNFAANLGYNPPGVDINVANVTNLTSWYISQTNSQLGEVAARLSPGDGSGTGNGTTENLRNLRLDSNSLSKNDYSYATLGGNFDIDLWFFSVNWLRFFTYFFDYAWRIWYSGRIFMRYWFGAAGTMAPIDIRSYRTTKATPLHVRLARLLTHPFVLFASGLVVAVLVVSVILGIYLPMLNSYIETCVDADATGAPSFMGDNVYAAAFNAAVLQGNRALSQGLNTYDTGRANICGKRQQNASDEYAKQQYQLRIVRDNMQTTASLLIDMENCTLDSTWYQLSQPFVYYTNLAGPPNPWHIPNCSVAGFDALGYLEPPPINCTMLPTCGTQCGVDVNVVQGVSRRATCQTEWYVHTTILQTVCTIVVFIFWNVCRTLLLDGLVRIYWKHLVRGSGLNFYSTCNRNGQIDTNTEDQLVVAIKQSDESSRRRGYFYVVMSFLLNIPYIVFCVLLNIDITYPY